MPPGARILDTFIKSSSPAAPPRVPRIERAIIVPHRGIRHLWTHIQSANCQEVLGLLLDTRASTGRLEHRLQHLGRQLRRLDHRLRRIYRQSHNLRPNSNQCMPTS